MCRIRFRFKGLPAVLYVSVTAFCACVLLSKRVWSASLLVVFLGILFSFHVITFVYFTVRLLFVFSCSLVLFFLSVYGFW